MDIEETVRENLAQKDAPVVEKEKIGGGSIEMQVDTVGKEAGWQEVRGKRAEKRAQGGSTGVSPAKPEAQRRAVEAPAGGSSVTKQNTDMEGAAEAARGEANEQDAARESPRRSAASPARR